MGSTSMKHYFECDCGCDEHRFCVTSEDSEEDFPPQLYFHIQMSQYKNITKRLFEAFRYVMGYKSKYGHWDTINVSEDDLNRMIVLFHQHRVKMEKFLKEREKKND
jgi:hypothetical protein